MRGSLQGRVYARERGRAPLASGVVGAHGISSILSRVGEFDNLGEVPAQPLSDGFVCGPRRSASQFACPVTVVAATLGPWETRGARAPHPRLELHTPGCRAGGGTRRSSVFTFTV